MKARYNLARIYRKGKEPYKSKEHIERGLLSAKGNEMKVKFLKLQAKIEY